jgi:hypothetical protein
VACLPRYQSGERASESGDCATDDGNEKRREPLAQLVPIEICEASKKVAADEGLIATSHREPRKCEVACGGLLSGRRDHDASAPGCVCLPGGSLQGYGC